MTEVSFFETSPASLSQNALQTIIHIKSESWLMLADACLLIGILWITTINFKGNVVDKEWNYFWDKARET